MKKLSMLGVIALVGLGLSACGSKVTPDSLKENDWVIESTAEDTPNALVSFSEEKMKVKVDTSSIQETSSSDEWEALGEALAKQMMEQMSYEVNYKLDNDEIMIQNLQDSEIENYYKVSKEDENIVFTPIKDKNEEDDVQKLVLKPFEEKDDSTKISESAESTENSSSTTMAEEASVETSDSEKQDDEAEATYADRTLTAPDGVLKITGFERSTDYEGKPMFYVFFDLTNNSAEPQNVQMQYMSFVNASQNTGATTEDLQMAMTMENPYREKADLLQKDINPGATISGVYYYNFADETKPVTFEFTDTMFNFDGPIATEDIQIP